MVVVLFLWLTLIAFIGRFCYIIIYKEIIIIIWKIISIICFLFVWLSWFRFRSKCLVIHSWKFWSKRNWFTVDCMVVGGNAVFLFCGVVIVGWIAEMLRCVVNGFVLTTSSFTKCDGVWISCCVRFLVQFNICCVLMNFVL